MSSAMRSAINQSVLILISVVALLGSVYAVVRAIGDGPSPWQNTGNPTLQKSSDLPPNIFPSSSNIDCIQSTVRRHLGSSMQNECLVATANGQASVNGVIFNGSTEMVPVVPPWPYQGLNPIVNQGMYYTLTSAPLIGSYLHIYRSIQDKMVPEIQIVNGVSQMRLNSNPEITLSDHTGTPVAVNVYAMAFSSNGSWMVADLPWKGLVRVNMATLNMMPFAPSMQQPSDFSNPTAQLSISNDGQNVVVKPSNLNEFKVYDLKNCSGAPLPVQHGTSPCPARNYWVDVTGQISGFRSLYQPRFINDTQVSFKTVYEYSPTNFKVATYTLTAPGISPTGIDYLGMGDSFASGEGAHSYIAGTDTDDNGCHLSSKAYAFILSSQLFQSGHAVSCSGAKTEDMHGNSDIYRGQTILKVEQRLRDRNMIQVIRNNYIPGYLVQSEFVDTYKPEAITLSIGGNNIGFGEILGSCVSPFSRPKACYPTYEDRLELNRRIDGSFNDLAKTYRSIKKPGKRVYIVGYPQIVVNGDCAVNVHFEASEIEMATDLIDYLNDTIRRAAENAGVRYVDVSGALAGHRMCEAPSDQVAVNGLTTGTDQGLGFIKLIGKESYHPNTLGHELLADAIRRQTNNLTQPMPGENPASQAANSTAVLDGRNLTKTGRTINNLVFDSDLTTDVAIRGNSITLAHDDTLKPGSTYKVMINGVQIGTGTANNLGTMNSTVSLPVNVDPGFQAIHVIGVNMLGRPLDITKTLYVAASSDDTDGDGVPDLSDSCRMTTNSGQDRDFDGTDDACDPIIGTPPPLRLSGLKASVSLTQNSITLVKP